MKPGKNVSRFLVAALALLVTGGLAFITFSLSACSSGQHSDLNNLSGFVESGDTGWQNPSYIESIAFVRWENGGSEIYYKPEALVSAGETNLTNMPSGRNTEPCWNPDATRIAFTSTRDGNPEIYVMNRDGSNVTRITNDEATDMSPAWSPDGTMLAFVSDRNGTNLNIYIMKPDGTEVARVTNNAGTDSSPCWSPDNTTIVFASNFDNEEMRNHLYLVGGDGTNQRRVSEETNADEGSPDWGKVNNLIVYERSDEAAGSQLWSIKSDGTGATRLTDGTFANQGWHASWSPDNMQLLFVSDRSSPPILYMMNADGTNTVNVTNTSAVDGQPAWGAQGGLDNH